jgi:hypothetical protein
MLVVSVADMMTGPKRIILLAAIEGTYGILRRAQLFFEIDRDAINEYPSIMADAPTPPKVDEDDENYVDFPMPEGFEPPKGTKPGKEFEALATLKIDEDGDLCLLKLDGADVKPEAEEASEPEGEEGESATDSMRKKLPETGMPSGMLPPNATSSAY